MTDAEKDETRQAANNVFAEEHEDGEWNRKGVVYIY